MLPSRSFRSKINTNLNLSLLILQLEGRLVTELPEQPLSGA